MDEWYDALTNDYISITSPAPECIHGTRCVMCFLASKGPAVDIDLGPDL